AGNGPTAHRLQTSLQQKFFEEWIANLHRWSFLQGLFVKLGRRHRCTVNAIAPGLGADIQNWITNPRRLAKKDLIMTYEPQCKCIYEGIQRIIIVECYFAAH